MVCNGVINSRTTQILTLFHQIHGWQLVGAVQMTLVLSLHRYFQSLSFKLYNSHFLWMCNIFEVLAMNTKVPRLKRKNIHLIVGEATQIKPNENQVMVGDKVVDYHSNLGVQCKAQG
jgi:hypothetical protein